MPLVGSGSAIGFRVSKARPAPDEALQRLLPLCGCVMGLCVSSEEGRLWGLVAESFWDGPLYVDLHMWEVPQIEVPLTYSNP